MSARRVRDKWRPAQQPPTEPLAYSSPLHAEEEESVYTPETPDVPVEETPPVKTIWDKIDEYGGEQAINLQ